MILQRVFLFLSFYAFAFFLRFIAMNVVHGSTTSSVFVRSICLFVPMDLSTEFVSVQSFSAIHPNLESLQPRSLSLNRVTWYDSFSPTDLEESQILETLK